MAWLRAPFNSRTDSRPEELYGGTKDGLSLDDVKDYPILLPPRREQERVVEWIEGELSSLLKVGGSAKRQIEMVREYRTRLIADSLPASSTYGRRRPDCLSAVPIVLTTQQTGATRRTTCRIPRESWRDGERGGREPGTRRAPMPRGVRRCGRECTAHAEDSAAGGAALGRERAGLGTETVAARSGSDRNGSWSGNGREGSAVSQADRLAHHTHTPVGYLYLREAPEDGLPIPDFRAAGEVRPGRPSPDLLETVHLRPAGRPGCVMN